MSFLLNPYSFGGGGGTPPTFKDAAVDSQATVADGDLNLVFLLRATAAAPAAPTGWTRIVDTNEAQGYGIGVYKAIHAGSNAAINGTNFPVGSGYLLNMTYDGTYDVLQIGALSDGVGNSRTVAALTNPTGSGSALVGWYSSRDPSSEPINSSESMTQRLLANALSFFDAALWSQDGVQSGNRTFNRTGSAFNHFGMLFEIG